MTRQEQMQVVLDDMIKENIDYKISNIDLDYYLEIQDGEKEICIETEYGRIRFEFNDYDELISVDYRPLGDFKYWVNEEKIEELIDKKEEEDDEDDDDDDDDDDDEDDEDDEDEEDDEDS